MADVAERVWARVESLLEAMGVELVDIETLGGSENRLLRVTIDRPAGVDLELCAEVSDVLGSLFEEVDPVSGRYTLEVSSPGVERRLKRPTQWKRSVGEKVKVKLAGGAGTVLGSLLEVDDRRIVVETEGGERDEIPFDEVTSGRTVFEWSEPGG